MTAVTINGANKVSPKVVDGVHIGTKSGPFEITPFSGKKVQLDSEAWDLALFISKIHFSPPIRSPNVSN